jgi:hypothetical protein
MRHHEDDEPSFSPFTRPLYAAPRDCDMPRRVRRSRGHAAPVL